MNLDVLKPHEFSICDYENVKVQIVHSIVIVIISRNVKKYAWSDSVALRIQWSDACVGIKIYIHVRMKDAFWFVLI